MMKKAAKPVIITLGIAVVLGAVLALLLLFPEKEEETSSDSHSHSTSLNFMDDEMQYPITAGKPDDLLTIKVENPAGGFTITREESSSESGESTEPSYHHTVSGLGEVPQNDKLVSYFVENMATLLAKELVEEHPQDISKYGLDTPTATVSLDFEEGEDIVLTFGMRKPADENYVYCMANDFVFLVDYYIVSDVFADAKTYAELVLTAKDGTPDNIKIVRPDFSEPVEIRYLSEFENPPEGLVLENTAKYTITSPIPLDVDPSKGKNLYEKLSGLEMTACEYVKKTPEILAECGFDNPAAIVNFTLGETEHTLTLGGNTADGGYYAILSTAQGVFSMSKRSAVWATFSLGDVVSRTPISPYIYACESIDIITKMGEFTFTNEGGKFSYHGKSLNENEFKSFFEELINVPCDEFFTQPTAGEAELVVKFTYSDKYAAVYGRKSDEFSYLALDGRKFVLNLNGNTVFKVNAVYVERVIEDINAITSG
ncbi:MAG: DUF4340 domain-containing protein [Oscillospiraceae bacterium]